MNFRANMTSLCTLSGDYYKNRITFMQYREQRSNLLKMIDEDLNGIKNIKETTADEEESIIEKALSFLKMDKLKETN